MAEIALLVPCHNAARFLPRLFESVCALTSPFAATLCYDDGSSDDTAAVARQLGWPILTGRPNRGVAHARNQLAAAARTEWIHFHDADDVIAPSYVATLEKFCDERHDVVSCDADWIDHGTGQPLLRWRYSGAALAREPLAHLLRTPLSLNSSIIRRSAWESVGGCDESLAMWEDADVHIRLARSGARFHHVSDVLTHSLRRSESFSHDYRKSWSCRVAALEHYATWPEAQTLRSVLATEAERAAAELAFLGDRETCERALALCQSLGGRPPTSRHPLIRALKPLVPRYHLLRWQNLARNRSHAAADSNI